MLSFFAIICLSGASNSFAQTFADSPPKSENITEAEKYFISKILVTGSTVFSESELGVITAPFEGREVAFEELEALRQKLTLNYIEKGYINSGAIIPKQDIENGVIAINVIEGQLTEIYIDGASHLEEKFIKDRIALYATHPLNINELQRGIWLLQTYPFIKKINAELVPGVIRGESALKAHVEESGRYNIWGRFSNEQSPSAGSERLEVGMAVSNLMGVGDSAGALVAGSQSLYDVELHYELPVTSHDTTVRIEGRKNASTVIEPPFDYLDIVSESETYSLSVQHPIYKDIGRQVIAAVSFDRRYGRTYLLGQPIELSEGDVNGRSGISAFRFALNWLDRNMDQVVAARSSLNWGIDAFGATVSDAATDGVFVSWLGQFQYARRLNESGLQSLLRADIQLAGEHLLAMERFAVGGDGSVRGYRKNLLVSDNGVTASLELRYPVLGDPLSGNGSIQLALFTDYGKSWNQGTANPNPDTIYSAGIGTLFGPYWGVSGQLYWGIPLKKIDRTGTTLQEQGIHFMIAAQPF
jgi:hemolysin activation/secretion protein